ncbi:hypothetical protein LTR62_000714 [Meristemomyces frigidus]|uniref:Bifunctional lycopene cyclase/phytoene synthase n=1 Tax=Meristemomyces frigidus TaxID=1508187 RepID=A0AAN7YMR4_9PEZI|nr:hypothetical protein LTR62_000714 [Meristemomyces frigidus]
MGYDYALVHLTYTVPPAILLSLIYAPLCTRLDLYKIAFLVTIAVLSTIPWDSYLIRTNIWSYPPNAVIGWKLFQIPVEEIFFFVIQTYNTSLLYLLLNKAVLHSIHLVKEKRGRQEKWKYIKLIGQLGLALAIKKGVTFIQARSKKTYLGLILVWALPFLFLLWSLAYQFLINLPMTSTLVPIALPTLYLWIVDTLALKRGTWVIETGTKTGIQLWDGLEIEEALFFLLTNCLIVFGLVAFDNAVAVLNTFPSHFESVPVLPSPAMLVRALLVPASTYDDDRILGLRQSVMRLKAKSRSFYLASSVFQGRLRIDLIILYSFCRVADDLIDNAESSAEARQWVGRLKEYLDACYSAPVKTADGRTIEARDPNQGVATQCVMRNFPHEARLTLLLLPTDRLSKEPLYELIKGFEMDLDFSTTQLTGPIKSEPDLDLYGARVAGTVALLCIQLVMHHYPGTDEAKAKRLMAAGHDMGIALQYTNIARDLGVDAGNKRVYIPPPWLKSLKLTAESFISGLAASSSNPSSDSSSFFLTKVDALRQRLLDRSFLFYDRSVAAIEELPAEARAPMRVAVESYMQIARELRRPGFAVKAGRATVPAWKRVWVAWGTLSGRPMGRRKGV